MFRTLKHQKKTLKTERPKENNANKETQIHLMTFHNTWIHLATIVFLKYQTIKHMKANNANKVDKIVIN